MSRKKPKTVSVVNHTKSGINIEIKMYPDDLTFFADLPDGSQINSTNGKDLSGQVHKWLSDNIQLEWQNVIRVKELSPFCANGDNFVGFEIERFHWARKLDRGLVKCEWLRRPDDIDQHHYRDKCGFFYVKSFHFSENFSPPCVSGHGDSVEYYIPYSDELWTGLEQMLKAIHEIKLNLGRMLSDTNGHQYLAIVGANILKALSANTQPN